MKRYFLFPLILVLTLACAEAPKSTPAPISEPSAPPLPIEVEVLKESYLDPIEQETADSLEDLYAKTRLIVVLPKGISEEDCALSAVVTRLGTSCAEAAFTVDGVPMYYRVGYTVEIENLADDEAAYPERTSLTYFETNYLLLLNETQGRVQWYDEKTGTSNSLFVPYNVEPRILEDTAISIMAAQRGEA